MADTMQISRMMASFPEAIPVELIRNFDEMRMGIGAVLRLLTERGGTSTARDISEGLGISGARVSALLRKMADRGLIVREARERDSRCAPVSLTEAGRAAAAGMRADMCRLMGGVIDRVGEQKLTQFLGLSREIREAFRAAEAAGNKE